MKIETFFENFELLTDAPNTVARLREIILELAVRGKLVPQVQNDESASDLLMKIQVERQLIEQKQIRSLKPLAPVDNFTFILPKNWEWERLGNLVAAYQTDIVDGPFGSNLKVDEYVESGVTILRLQNVDRNRFV
jgi:type I restriction enzyme S subunit